MQSILELIARHRRGEPCGLFSVCSAHPLVLEATLRHAARSGASFTLIEATSNQVNQDGGYTGMRPQDFCGLVLEIAARIGVARTSILLGGDHLGPNPWQSLPAEEAMSRADALIAAYVAAGFRKIHLDCSMACGDDAAPLPERTIAERAARLCSIAERAHARAGGERPVYVIGTEVPVPGGAAKPLKRAEVTEAEAARQTIEMHRESFAAAGLAAAWNRVIAIVVQPGVEFDHRNTIGYVPQNARALKAMVETYEGLVFEAHSTDYQTPAALSALVRDHFAILKVGPALTFSLREALWALDAIEREWIEASRVSALRQIVLARMKANPQYWTKYYHAQGRELDYELQYSLSDRIRYYWSDPEIVRAQTAMFRNLIESPPPLALLSQYMPIAHAALKDGLIGASPPELVMAHISRVIDGYHAAVTPVAGCH